MKQLLLRVRGFCQRHASPAFVFCALMALCFSGILIAIPFTEGNSFLDLFFRRGDDLFMDFFNSVRDSAQGLKSYTVRWIIYPPMANLFFYLFSFLFPDVYLNTPFFARLSWWKYESAVAAVVIFLAITLIAVFMVCFHPHTFGKGKGFAIALFCTLSLPVLFGCERGNIILLSSAAAVFYLFNYNHEKRWRRELSLVALAFAFAIKLYPAVFGLFLITEKRWKDAAKCILYAVLMMVLPCFFFGGFALFPQWYQNITGFSSEQSVATAWYQWMFSGIFTFPYYLLLVAGAALAFFTGLLHHKRNTPLKKILFLCTIIICVPSVQGHYVWSLMLAPLLLLFAEKRWTGWNIAYFIGMVLPLLPLPLFVTHTVITNVFIPHCTLFLLLVCMADAVVTIRRHFIDKKEGQNGGKPSDRASDKPEPSPAE